MTMETIHRVVRLLDERQGRLWEDYGNRTSDDEIPAIFEAIDEIDAERRRLVNYLLDTFGYLPSGMTKVY